MSPGKQGRIGTMFPSSNAHTGEREEMLPFFPIASLLLQEHSNVLRNQSELLLANN